MDPMNMSLDDIIKNKNGTKGPEQRSKRKHTLIPAIRSTLKKRNVNSKAKSLLRSRRDVHTVVESRVLQTNQLFISGLDPMASDHDLWDLFEQLGAKVKMVSVQLRREKREKTAHAVFHTFEDATKVRNECNNRELDGQTITVEIFRKLH